MIQHNILQTLRQYQQDKQQEYQILRIGLFGSAVHNSLTEPGDIDVVVELGHADLFVLVGIKQELETLFHRPVDIIRYREHMNPFLKRRIDQEAIYV